MITKVFYSKKNISTVICFDYLSSKISAIMFLIIFFPKIKLHDTVKFYLMFHIQISLSNTHFRIISMFY